MKPGRILIFIFSVFSVLAVISFLFPEDGIKISENFTLNFISIKDIINPAKQEKVDISTILDNTTVDDDTVVFEEKEVLDSVLIDSQYVYYEPVPLKIDSVIRYLEFPDNNRSILNKFFEELATIKGKPKMLRIMHYGDSQIETDRMTKYFRYKLQTQFGGYGPGFVSTVQAYDFKSPVIQVADGDWHRYTAYGRKDTTVLHRRYGVLANFCQFSPIITDTAFSLFNSDELNSDLKYEASLTFSHSPYSYKITRDYKRCRMFYGNVTEEVNMKVYSDENNITTETLPVSEGMTFKTWTFNSSPKDLKFEFESKESPEFYGFAFDGFRGVAVDNIAMRGSGGLIFTRMDLAMLARFYSMLNTKLLILQFGGNVVPGERENYDFYRKRFASQLRTIKRIAPEMTIIVIGLADMSKKDKDLYISYPNIVLIRDALKKAAFDNGCAYWDMFEAMGGENSMPSWVFHDPPLAEKDFTHFNPAGAKVMAKMFYNAFIYEYNLYLRKRK